MAARLISGTIGHNRQVGRYRLMYLMGHEDVETTGRYHFAYVIIASCDSISHLDKLDLINGDRET